VLKETPENYKIDSLLNHAGLLVSNAEQLFLKRNCNGSKSKYIEARRSYEKVLAISSNNIQAKSEIRRINKILDTLCIVKPPPGKSYNFTVRRSPENREIRITGIRYTNDQTIITLELKPTTGFLTIYGPGTEGAFYIEYNNRTAKSRLVSISGIQPNKQYKGISNTLSFQLYFNKLPEYVKEFNLLEGENRENDTESHWNFIGIKLQY
jgi:triacylglycerol esterase/lipase EstA (alpha/beta hydrolase family)